MSRNWFKRMTPSREKVARYRILRLFGDTLFRPAVWRFSRDSVARAMAVGLFWALIPMPMQMIPAAVVALRLRANVAISLALVWLTNPITMPPICYGAWRLGCLLMGRPGNVAFELSIDAIRQNLWELGVPLVLGSLVAGLVLSALGYFTGAGIRRLPAVRKPGLRLRAGGLRGLRPVGGGGVLVQRKPLPLLHAPPS